jgi:ABC-type nitrate/sulfonate/bicarbonate transport system substrate-binding protein
MPRAVHAGIYLAIARGYDATEGAQLRLRTHGDPVRLLTDGKVNLALVRRAELRAPLVGVMAVEQDPLLVLAATEDTLADRRPEVRAVIRALQRGYTEALTDPESAVGAMVDQVDGLDRARVQAAFERIAPSLVAGAPVYGALPEGRRFDRTLVGPISRD